MLEAKQNMKIDKINDMQVVCELSEEELNTMDLHMNTFMDDKEKSSSFLNALVDVALEHTNMLKIKEQAYLNLSVDKEKKKIKVLINAIGETMLPDELYDEIASLLQSLGIEEPFLDEEEDEFEEDDSDIDELTEYRDDQYYAYRSNLEQMADKIKYSGYASIEFKSLDEITTTLKKYNKEFCGESEQFKKDNRYILVLTFSEKLRTEYDNLIMSLADFVKMKDIPATRKAYLKEHYETIIAKDAFNKMLHL